MQVFFLLHPWDQNFLLKAAELSAAMPPRPFFLSEPAVPLEWWRTREPPPVAWLPASTFFSKALLARV